MTIKRTARGGALIYVLIAIALLAALTASFMTPATHQTRAQNSFKLAAELNSQLQMIRASIQDCTLRYPEGDPSIPANHNGGYHASYPVDANSTHLSEALRAPDKDLARLRCPGRPIAGQSPAHHGPIFDGSAARFDPAPPALFGPWTYRNGSDLIDNGEVTSGVYFRITTTSTDPYLADAMQRVKAQYSPCEIDVIVGDGTNGCPAANQCLRVWIKRVAPACP